MNIETKNMGTHDLYRVGTLLLIQAGAKLGMELESGEIGLNQNSGNVYLRSEDYMFTLYIPMNKAKASDVSALRERVVMELKIAKPEHVGSVYLPQDVCPKCLAHTSQIITCSACGDEGCIEFCVVPYTEYKCQDCSEEEI